MKPKLHERHLVIISKFVFKKQQIDIGKQHDAVFYVDLHMLTPPPNRNQKLSMSDRPRCNQPAAVNPLLREAKDQQQHCGYSCERPSPESLNVVRCSAFELTVDTRQTDRRTVGRVMRPARGGLRNKQLTMSGQPLVVLNANWSKHHC